MFLAFPLEQKPSWKQFPLVTLLLISVSVCVWFGPQRQEERRMERAQTYYDQSGLARIELPLFVRHLRSEDTARSSKLADYLERGLATPDAELGWALEWVQRSPDFLAGLPKQSRWSEMPINETSWEDRRVELNRQIGGPFTMRWALNPAALEPATLLTAAFLHGSLDHLLGNMVFLFAFGYTVELALGKWRYLVAYLLCGLAGSAGYIITHWGSSVSALGASGAISGLMAMYSVWFGLKRIRFFYILFFYFDYVRARALLLLPIWLTYEIVQYWLHRDSGVANTAHAGGLVGGAILMGAWKLWIARKPKAEPASSESGAPNTPNAADWDSLAKRATELLRALRLDDARQAFARLVKLRPRDTNAVTQFYRLCRMQPATEQYHQAAVLVCGLTGNDQQVLDLQKQVAKEYFEKAQPRPMLTPDHIANLAESLAKQCAAEEVQSLTNTLARLDPKHPKTPAIWLALVASHLRARHMPQAQACLALLRAQHAQSVELRSAESMMRVS